VMSTRIRGHHARSRGARPLEEVGNQSSSEVITPAREAQGHERLHRE
jgi:hypothetical protein